MQTFDVKTKYTCKKTAVKSKFFGIKNSKILV